MIGQRFILCTIAAFAVLNLAAACTDGCAGGSGESCETCSATCGTCDSVNVVTHCTAAGTVHISFDDAPNQFSGQVLDLMKSRNVSASFWIIGKSIAGQEAVIQRMHAEGHHIGDKTWDGYALNNYTTAQVIDELTRCKAALETLIPGLNITTMRPPAGDLNTPVREAAQSMGLTPVMWNFDCQDWRGVDAWEVGNVTGTLSGYSRAAQSFLLVSHPNTGPAFARLSWVMDQVLAAGYKFVSYDECVNPNAVADPNLVPAGTPNLPECIHAPWVEAYDVQCGNGIGCGQSADGSVHCCSQNGYCGLGAAFCGAGCLGGACDTCVKAGLVPHFNATSVAAITGGSTAGVSGATGGGSSSHGSSSGVDNGLPSAASALQFWPSLLLMLPAALLYLRRGRK